MTQEEIKKQRKAKAFFCNHKTMSWEEMPIEIRKEVYPYYFDENGNDCYPIKQKN